ncbi:hypothetical protein DSAG12_03871 [Promethearchaeum syntrophicum]|uniref:Uncharacterized protein n=1 Tax=Promethearchaeum syntrophicum TaxID=2594042 RepID=A0A5B9DH18_9ARCH|nr:hypothetical protein [Candidatus Prometheoarchaeum syntrophicum]
MASKAPILASQTQEEKGKNRIQFKKNLQFLLMIFIPYVFFAYLTVKLNNLGSTMGIDSISGIISNFFSDFFQADFIPFIMAVTLILILIVFLIGINKKEQKNIQIKSGMNAEDTSEKSSEPSLYRISVAGKEIKFSMIFSILIIILDIILIFTSHLVGILWGYNHTFEIIFYVLLSISIIIAIISIWLSLKPRDQEKGKNVILFGIQYLCFLGILSFTYWRETDLGTKIVESPQALFLVIFIVSCLGIGVSLLSGSKKDQLNLLFFTFYFTVGNFVSVFVGYSFITQFLIITILSAVIGVIVVKYRNASKIKINLPLILYGIFISGSLFAISDFVFYFPFRWAELTILFSFSGIVFIMFQVMALIQLFINSSNLKEELSNDDNYLKMIYFIELIGIIPSWMYGWSFYTISIIILGIINFGLLFIEHKFKKNIYLGALLLNVFVFIPNILIRVLSNWTYENIPDMYFGEFNKYILFQQFYLVFMGILTSITLAIPWFREYRNKKKNLVEE